MGRAEVPGGRRGGGFALLVSLSALSLLAVLALSLASLSRVAAQASASHVDGVRARQAALSGFDYALARLLRDAGEGGVGGPDRPWVYGGGDLATATSPSYAAGAANGFSYSGTIGGTHAPLGDQFSLKIDDSHAKLNVVGLAVEPGVLGAMLDNLGRALALEARGKNGRAGYDPIVGRGMAMASMAGVPGSSQVRDHLVRLLGRRDTDFLDDYVSYFGWIDPRTIKPTGGTGPNRSHPFAAEPRPPINVNAASRPVLIAAIAGLQAQNGEPLSFDQAVEVADAILARRADPAPGQGPFRDWPDFYEFILGRVAKAPRFTEGDAWTILANADPNFHPTWLNLERVIAPVLDKTDLRLRTTEFCFHDSGTYDIASLGRIVAYDGRVLASAKLVVSVRLFDVLRHTVQEEFEAHRGSTAAEHTCTWPNPPATAGGRPAWWGGHIQVQTDRPSPLPLAQPPSFSALFRDGIAADSARGSAVPLTDQEAGPDVAEEGDLFPDGLFTSPDRDELTRFSTVDNMDGREGTVELWVKFDQRKTASPLTLFAATCPLTSEVGLQHRIRASLDDGTLRVESQRLCYVSSSVGSTSVRASWPVPFLHEETTVALVVPGGGQPHEWHHLLASWTDGTQQTLLVDGQPGIPLSQTLTSPSVVFSGWPPYTPLLALSGDGAGELSPDTLDDLRVYPSATPPDERSLPRPRFEEAAPGQYAGRFVGGFDPAQSPLPTLGVRWTAWIPRSYNGIPFPAAPWSVGLELDAGDGPVAVENDGGRSPLVDGGLGRVPAGTSLRYTFTFRRNPGPGSGNVAPLVDDITVLYAVEPPQVRQFVWVTED
ncbi:MAG: hypothetical protein HYZ53_09750 [Planctomycetes bacterium]|nr:hypothetical protein [Planctomycetota bacterium]